MRYTTLFVAGIAFAGTFGCTAQAQNDGFTANENGLESKVITKGTGTQEAKVGDFGEMHVKFKIADSVLINTFEMNNGEAVTQQFQASAMKGDLMEGLLTMKAGDSTVFRILMDTLSERSKQPKPEWAKPGDYAVWEVKMVDIKTKEQIEQEQKEKELVQQKKDDQIIQDYLKEKGIKNAQKTESGLYYILHEAGAGAAPQAGQQATVNYTGMDLKGEKFDSNVDPQFQHVQPFTFAVGQRQVIKGWDEAALLLKKGGKATFILPSHLAYGPRGSGAKIPPNAILIFDIELTDFK